MPSTSFTDDQPIVAPTISAEAGRVELPPSEATDDTEYGVKDVDKAYWERCLADAERAEADWRSRGRDIVKIYRNDGASHAPVKGKKADAGVAFNILYSNTEVMLPAVYAKPPQPVVRSRFVKKSAPPQPAPMPGPPPGLMAMLAGQGGGMGGGPPPPMSGMGGGGQPPISPTPLPGVPITEPGAGGPPSQPPSGAGGAPGSATAGAPPAAGPPKPAGPPPMPMPMPMMAPAPAPMPAGMPRQQDIETAAAVVEKVLEIILDDDSTHEAVKAAVKDCLLPGRGVCRVRWHPQLEEKPIDDPVMGGPLTLPGAPPDAPPQTETIKVWETVSDEYVYWEDVLFDPVRQFGDTKWLAFRHLFDEKALLAEFSDSEELMALKEAGKLSDVLKWTEESAAKHAVGGGSPLRSSEKLGDVIKKAMVWEIWDQFERKVIWFIREVSGITLRVDPDSLGLTGFFPTAKPLLAVVTTDTMLPKPYYDLYAKLANDLDETSIRISRLTEKIKVRGGYNSASKDIQGLLTADDGKMLPIDGVDMVNGGLQNHIWIVPILDWVNALRELYVSRNEIKQAIYEVMGISDIMRGATDPDETATAQRIKGTMGVGRLEGQKQATAAFIRDHLRLKAEIVCKNFDAATLTRMTGEEVTDEVLAILRDDFDRTCSIDIETDSTVAVDETVEQESNAKIMMTVQGIMTGSAGLLKLGILPPPMIMQFTLELMKMMLQPIRNSRGVVELIDDFQEQLAAQIMSPMMGMGMPGMGGQPAPGMGAPPGPETPQATPPGGASPPMNGGMLQ